MLRRLLFLLLVALVPLATAAPALTPLVTIPSGTYKRGLDHPRFPDESPAHEVTVSAFQIEIHEVTNDQFAAFVASTGYRTQAERGWSAKDFPKSPPDQLKPGALVFSPPPAAVQKSVAQAHWQWWRFVPGASWRHPSGPGSDLEGKGNHPVVCVTWDDASAYAKWTKRRLPTEAEWEKAARGGLDHALFSWGSKARPEAEKWPANIFTGTFPHQDTAADGFAGTAPVKSFAPNGYGLYDLAGNVWEICADFYRPDTYARFLKNPVEDPTGPKSGISEPMVNYFLQHARDPSPALFPNSHRLSLLRVVKGGSFLCHHSYCLRYRPAARHYTEALAPTNHTGFRCAK